MMHTDYVWHTPWLVSVYGEFKWLTRNTLHRADLLYKATASNSCRKNIGLSKLPPDSTVYCKVADRWDILSFFLQQLALKVGAQVLHLPPCITFIIHMKKRRKVDHFNINTKTWLHSRNTVLNFSSYIIKLALFRNDRWNFF